MYIDRKLDNYIINSDCSILETLRKINVIKGRIVVVIENHNVVKGVVTNGDILRWLIEHPNPDLNNSILSVTNKGYKFAYENDSVAKIHKILENVLFVPVINGQGQLVGIARREQPKEGVLIGNKFVGGRNTPCFVIAEIGNNHNGSLLMAKRLIDASVAAGADCAKFQMRSMQALYQNAGNPNDEKENLGSQYTLDLLSRFQLNDDQLFEAFDYCKEKGIIPLCTAWDLNSLKKLENYGLSAYKVASADLTNHELLIAFAKTGKPLICSTGMSAEDEIKQAITLLRSYGTAFILLHCNSTYPAPFADINLKYLTRLQELVDAPVGYSGHERGINISVAAVGLGAKVIERHITLDRLLEGSDHKASLLPDEFKKMIQGIREVEEGLGQSTERKITQGEMMNRVNLAKSLIINQDIKTGRIIEEGMIDIKSPGRGLQPNAKNMLVGRKAKHDFKAGDFFFLSDIEDEIVSRRNYKFSRRWGIPVRYSDYNDLIKDTNPDFVEFHLSYKDLTVDFPKYISRNQQIGFVVHSPELFAGDHLLDLCSLDENYRKRSIRELQGVIDITRKLNSYFPLTKCPLIVVNVGGFSQDRFLNEQEKNICYKLLIKSFSELNQEGVELIPQTMPPFPWHFGGQRYHNLFVSPSEIKEFCNASGYRICLDTSHSKLACTHYGWSFFEFLKQTAPFSAHLHIADSQNTGEEGLQIGKGEIDFYAMAEVLNKYAPDSSFIPEIWQGHENNGEGFWIALSHLEPIIK